MARNKKQPAPAIQSLVYRGYDAHRHPPAQPPPPSKPLPRRRRGLGTLAAGLVLLVVAVYGYSARSDSSASQTTTPQNNTATSSADECKSNKLNQFVLVSISKRHMWACQNSKQVYDAPVVSGMAMYAADLTPPGTYHVYDRETEQDLTGCDTTGCWNDPVHYWLPWLQNQYGIYGFHDATWRPDNAFGNIDPNSKNASHGCVELPLVAAKWLYNWAQVGLTVKIES